MSKIIIFCADGTWNGPGEPDDDNTAAPPTNVFKLFLNLAGADLPDTMMLAKEQERVLKAEDGSALQWAKYLHGVGDSNNFMAQMLGGTIGSGLIARIVRGYTFISRNYVPGDQTFIIGFSRGAYTARALAGLIAAKGLLDATKNDLANRESAYRLGSAVWFEYRQMVAQSMSGWLVKLTNFAADLPAFLQQPVPDNQLIKAPIEAVAVWDTVGSLGIPEYTLQDTRLDFFQFADKVLSPVVKHGVHAVAVDERRVDFTPTLWDPHGRITQALFPGCHSDVGGGFVGPGIESGLSDCTLQWMMEQLTELGVTFAKPPLAYVPQPNARATAHATWLSGIWSHLPKGPRVFPPTLYLSEEVIDRVEAGPVISDPSLPASPYAPENLQVYLAAGGPAPGITVV
ncbi:MAG TPA: DUF2235 domain-containing protein [Acetobacteraceae bacterium]|jgi:uncharacterized protein (DUF2235 family)|nr:DUF2235 domain-containing protein [Acetobacteraceae bacterium]